MRGFVYTAIALVILFGTVSHVCAAAEYGKAKKLPEFVTFALSLFMLVGWPLFAVGMMFSGYGAFWDRTWPEKNPVIR